MATGAVTIDTEDAKLARPYDPGWVNLLTAWIERLPGPTWGAYAVAMALGVALAFSAALNALATPSTTIANAYYGLLPFAILALIHSLDRTAGGALRALRAHLDMDDAEVAETHHRLTVIPATPTAILALVSFGALTPLGYVMDPVGSGIVDYAPATLVVRWFWESAVSTFFLVLIYHTVRQLRLIGRIHERVREVDVFDQGPLYAMSAVTSRTAIGLVILILPGLFLLPDNAELSFIVLTAAWYFGAVAIAGASFILPMWGVHERLAAEKRRLQGETGRRLSATLTAIHAAMDAGDGGAIEDRNRALAALVTERDLVARIPTWPWSTGALTGFVSAVLLPLALFLVQQVLSRLV
ncbi:MAG: hypothetical protein AB1736_12420 [Chloroflexota bacterium]